VIVPAGLDWQIGEQIVIAPTNMRTMDTDICTITDYNIGTGRLTCEETIMGYHYGDDQSTAADFDGVDMRAEVALLSRNIEITGSNDQSHTATEPWNCRILVADFFEQNAEMTLRAGHLNMDFVSVHKCGQKFTWKSAIKWENALMGRSKVSNSAIHQGRSPGIIITKSMNVELKDNVVTDFAEHGIWAMNSQRVVIDGNWVFHVVEQADLTPKMIEYNGWKGGFTLSEGTNSMTVVNNVVAGTWHHGFHFKPSRCGETNPSWIFENNIAHSISGYGAIALNVVNPCTEVHDFKAYKVTEASIMLGGASAINRGLRLTSIDTRYGNAIHSGAKGRAEIIESKAYGELIANKDCPQGSPCDHCLDSRGMVLNMPAEGAHLDRQEKFYKLPLFKVKGGAMQGDAIYTDNRFVDFTTNTKTCGSRQAAIMPYLAPDYTPYARFEGVVFDNVNHGALTYFQDPPQKWANLEDCVEFTCTGMYNIVTYFKGVRLTGQNTPMVPQRFSIISDNKESVSAQVIPSCEKQNQWNAWICTNRNIGVMIFDNQDPDRMDRALQPVYIQNKDGFNNRLNAYMDHCWDGFYTCQKRESRFPSIVYQQRDYNIEFTGTPPSKQEFRLYGRIGSPGFVVTIKYNAAGAYTIYDQNRNEVQATPWDPVARTWAAP